MNKEGAKTTKKDGIGVIIISACFCVLVLAIAVTMSAKNSRDLHSILESSVKNQLIATSVAARGYIDVDDFISYTSIENTEADKGYEETLTKLRQLAANVDAEYIYVLKEIDGAYYFVFDTDAETDTRFTEYELSPVHAEAFAGHEAADIMNVSDEFGSFNTGAVPLMKGDEVVGVVATDISDVYIEESQNASLFNTVLLAAILIVTLGIMLTLVIVLTRRVRRMQGKLEQMAHYDTITGLPNRQYLMEYLGKITGDGSKEPFALLFVDLDNFKSVNDNAGHDAGDELLLHIAQYLETMPENSKSFRPSAGRLNIAARIGGDEFIQVVSGVSDQDEAAGVAQALLDNFQSQKLDRFIEKYNVGLSIGVALYPYHTEDYNVLIKYADVAMYYAKNAGKNSYRIYADEMGKEDDDISTSAR